MYIHKEYCVHVCSVCTCGRPRGNEISKMASHDPATVTHIYIEVPIYSATHTTENIGATHTIASLCGACVCVIIIIGM